MVENDKNLFRNNSSDELIRLKKDYNALESELSKLRFELTERNKELNTIYKFSSLLTRTISLTDFLKEIIQIISEDSTYSEASCARIIFDGEEHKTNNFRETNWKLSENIIVQGEPKGTIEVFYEKQNTNNNKVPFLKEKMRLVKAIAEKMGSIINKKILEKEVSISDERFSVIFMENPNAMVLSDLEKEAKIIEVNEAFIKKTGYKRDEIIGKKSIELEICKDILTKEKIIDQLEKSDFVENLRVELITRDGNPFYATLNAKIVIVKNQKFILTSFIDISETEIAKQQLEDNNRMMHNILHALDDAYLQVDNNGIVLQVNSAAPKMFGYNSEKEMIGMPTTQIMSSEDREIMLAKLMKDKILNDYVLHAKRKDNSRLWISFNMRPTYDANGNITGRQEFARDITQRIELEKDLIEAKEKAEESESKFRNAFENSGIGMCLVGLNGTFLKVNKAMTKILGYSKEELVNLSFQEITFPEDLDLDINLLNETLEGKHNSYYLKKRYIHKEGKLVHANLNVSLIRNDEDRPLFFVSQIEDVTRQEEYVHELKLAKEKAEESDRLKTAFLLNVSHEIRTPMNGILGFLELLNQPNLADKERSEFITLINKSGERLTNTINDIVEISKIEIGDLNVTFEEIDLSELMNYYHGFFKPQTNEKNLEFKITQQIKGASALIKTDKHKLDGILMNLIRNAIKFTDKGKIEFGNYVKDNKLWFYVSDTGKGIPKDRLEAIFNRFVQADQGINRGYEGSGIGLSIVKAYIEVLGGEIEVLSEPGKGSTFIFYIPYNPGSKVVESISEKDGIKQKEQTILIAEDDELNCELLERMLEDDYSLLFARTGAEAVDLFADHPEISIVLMDIKMPGDFNGLEAIRKIKAINDQIPVVAQTAFAMDLNRIEAFEAGCDGYITKPYGVESLKSTIKSFL